MAGIIRSLLLNSQNTDENHVPFKPVYATNMAHTEQLVAEINTDAGSDVSSVHAAAVRTSHTLLTNSCWA